MELDKSQTLLDSVKTVKGGKKWKLNVDSARKQQDEANSTKKIMESGAKMREYMVI